MTTSEEIWYRCPYCSFACTDATVMEKHIEEKHPEKTSVERN